MDDIKNVKDILDSFYNTRFTFEQNEREPLCFLFLLEFLVHWILGFKEDGKP